MAALVLSAFSLQLDATVIVGGNYGGANLSPSNGDVLSGTFTNVGTFQIPAGVTVLVDPGTPLFVNATTIIIAGTLDGRGSGFGGGANGTGDPGLNGQPGFGPGAGAGGLFGPNIHGDGGGGGGYGGPGGNSGSYFGSSPAPAPGGPVYGVSAPPGALMGSGGGGAANWLDNGDFAGGAGGAGGGSITLVTTSQLSVTATGVIRADGAPGAQGQVTSFPGFSTSGGGGGSGGTIWLSGVLSLDGLLSALGGNGADANAVTDPQYGQGGGGGGGGRIKLSGTTIFLGSGFLSAVGGGAAGVSSSTSAIQPTLGGVGTFVDGSVSGTTIACGAWTSEVGTWGPASPPCGDLTSTTNKTVYESESFGTTFGDFAYEVQMVCTRPNQPTAANTLIVRGAPQPYQTAAQWWSSGLAFSISMAGKFSIFRFAGTSMIPIQSWTTPVGTSINPSGVANTLTVEATGGTLTFSINGTPVKTITGQTLLTGQVGLGMVRSIPTTAFGPNDTLVVKAAAVTSGSGLKPAAVSARQEKANEDANRALQKPDPFFSPK